MLLFAGREGGSQRDSSLGRRRDRHLRAGNDAKARNWSSKGREACDERKEISAMRRKDIAAEDNLEKLAVIYARVSSREQKEEGYSIEAQIKLLRSYAEKNGLSVIGEFIDVQTAKDPGRDKFEEMIKTLESLKMCRTILVEKTDRLARNDEDMIRLKRKEFIIHFVKEGTIYSKDARAHTKFMQNIQLATATFYSDNLSEEVIKGMTEKASQGFYPGRAPFGYRNNRETRNIEPSTETSEVVKRAYELYATGRHSLLTLGKQLREEFGKVPTRSYLHYMLKNTHYVGLFEWRGVTYRGKYATFISQDLFDTVQSVLAGFNKPKYGAVEIAFRGLMKCKHCGCVMTGERKKGRYVYYHCTGYHGKCPTPWLREEEVSSRLGTALKDIRIPSEVVAKLIDSLQRDQERVRREFTARRERLEKELDVTRRRQDEAYKDKLDGRVNEEFWNRQMSQLVASEHRISGALAALTEPLDDKILNVARTLELAQNAHSLYLAQNSTEQAKLLSLVLSNSEIDEVSVYHQYKMPFNLIAQRAKTEDWLGGLDSNQDSQSQSLESYQLDDLPAGRNKKESRHVRLSRRLRFNLSNLIGNARRVNQTTSIYSLATINSYAWKGGRRSSERRKSRSFASLGMTALGDSQ
jgi:site-specific DNA recombinase